MAACCGFKVVPESNACKVVLKAGVFEICDAIYYMLLDRANVCKQ